MNPKLKRHRTLDNTTTVLGLPVELFAMVVLFASFGIGLFIYLAGWLTGLILSLVYVAILFVPLNAIHKDDLHAWRLWMDILNHTELGTQHTLPKDIRIITPRGTRPLTQWTPSL
ncbi:hypothetical protein MD535_22380 [Vibrio sp. ZSDZ65]|uniref:Uncharacterized protein n=1 Tax=Vibrio qingdaonensis TaxID=2829491 RepID=A0A9X3HYF4_9VIBR|nr:hypothetical protein [Vibrio qingdaonensis]MCW8348740.1 hypothetical protein [Vibrio qingdaonensis]